MVAVHQVCLIVGSVCSHDMYLWTSAFLAGVCPSAFTQWESFHLSLHPSVIEGGGGTRAAGRLPEQLVFFLLLSEKLT